jgi:hypothetical protein
LCLRGSTFFCFFEEVEFFVVVFFQKKKIFLRSWINFRGGPNSKPN